MSEDAANEKGLLSPRKIAVQLLGFLVGVALLIWCIKGAIEQGRDEQINAWDRLLEADPRLVLAMLGCTIASAIINGSVFWLTSRPFKHLRWLDMQYLNLVGNMLNYAPIRLGAIARVFYHLRVDRLSLLQIGGWFVFIGYALVLGTGSCLLATLVHDQVDWIWFVLVLAQMALGGLLITVLAGNRLLIRHGRGVERILQDPRALWGALALRIADLAAYAARMAVALTILGIELPASHIVVLAVVALTAGLIPFGRLGFREFCVAITAQRLSMLATDVESNMQLLALVESAGEAIVFIPFGALSLWWYRRRVLAAGIRPPEDHETSG